MKSLTKNLQTQENLSRMCKQAFPQKEMRSAKELSGGFFGAAYLIVFSDGEEAVLKIAPPGGVSIMSYEKNIMAAEVESMKLIKENTSLPVAKILYYSTDHILCSSDYFFMEKLPGMSYADLEKKMPEEEKHKIDVCLGRYDKAINQIHNDKFGYFSQPEYQGTDWYQVFSLITESVLKDGEALKVDIGVSYDEIRNLLRQSEAFFKEVTVPCLVHWDLWSGNVLIENGQVSGIIDFERCLWADPLMELGFRRHYDASSFFEGYGKTEFTMEEQIRRIWYDVYLFLIMTIECDYRQYEDRNSYYWAKNMLKDSWEDVKSKIV